MADVLLHRPACRTGVPGARRRRWIALGLHAGLAAPLLAGCAVSMPISSMMPGDDAITGSLALVPFGQILDEEDRRREKAALSTALDPQGDGATIHWENPKTGHKGAITAVGHAYPEDAKVCRGFTSELKHNGGLRTMDGTACIVAAGEWAVKTGKPVKKA